MRRFSDTSWSRSAVRHHGGYSPSLRLQASAPSHAQLPEPTIPKSRRQRTAGTWSSATPITLAEQEAPWQRDLAIKILENPKRQRAGFGHARVDRFASRRPGGRHMDSDHGRVFRPRWEVPAHGTLSSVPAPCKLISHQHAHQCAADEARAAGNQNGTHQPIRPHWPVERQSPFRALPRDPPGTGHNAQHPTPHIRQGLGATNRAWLPASCQQRRRWESNPRWRICNPLP